MSNYDFYSEYNFGLIRIKMGLTHDAATAVALLMDDCWNADPANDQHLFRELNALVKGIRLGGTAIKINTGKEFPEQWLVRVLEEAKTLNDREVFWKELYEKA